MRLKAEYAEGLKRDHETWDPLDQPEADFLPINVAILTAKAASVHCHYPTSLLPGEAWGLVF